MIAAPSTDGNTAAAFESAELIDLFLAYSASPDSIGAQFVRAAAQASADDPLIVATGTDLALFPGGGRPPEVESFRVSTRGFKELAGVSHLGPALATLARMKELDADGPWRAGAEELLAAVRTARSANTEPLWRDRIAVGAFVGREAAIATMIDYSCEVTERIIERALDDGAYLTAETLRRDYLEGPAEHLPVPFNRVMVGTFFLAGMDIAHRIITWFDSLEMPWERAMVIIAGRQGRPTAGVTTDTNSVAGVIEAASRGRLPARHLLIAPHAPVFPMFDGSNLDAVAALEQEYRQLWSGVIATSELGGQMFDGFPHFAPPSRGASTIGSATKSVTGMPTISRPDDWRALITRLRVVLEDPRQLLSGAVTDYASRQLVDNGNRPSAVTVPGLDGEPYPQRTAVAGPSAVRERGARR
jgi:hypothetical protein